MTWNYRVMRHIENETIRGGLLGGVYFALHEVYYNSEGNPWGWSAEPEAPMEETVEEMRTTLTHMLAALDKPVLDFDMQPAPMDLPDDDDYQDSPKAETPD